MKKIITAMSGGVDSSAAALILQNEGYTVAGELCAFLTDRKAVSAEKMRLFKGYQRRKKRL